MGSSAWSTDLGDSEKCLLAGFSVSVKMGTVYVGFSRIIKK